MSAHPRRLATTLAVVVAAVSTLPFLPGAASAAADGACPPGEGVTVVVDFTDIGGEIETRCAPGDPVSGRQALHAAGFTPDDTAFFCTIDARPDPCDFATTSMFWSYWYATPESTWDFQLTGADDSDPEPGDVEGWRYNDGSEGPSGGPPVPGPVTPLPDEPAEPGSLSDAAAWLTTALVGGDHVELGGNARYDLTADVALGLLAAETEDEVLDDVLDFLETGAADYAHGAEFVDDGELDDAIYAGGAAKLGLVALLTGGDPSAVGGLDLVADLGSIETGQGRFVDNSAFADQSNVFTQSLAVLLLAAVEGVNPSPASIAFLEAEQCADGGFPVYFDPDSCASDPDATGIALQALSALGSDGAPGAVSYLASTRSDDGSWSSATPGASGANVNSTAYAAIGLRAAGVDTTSSATWLASVANPDGGLPVVSEAGLDSDVFATAQALTAMAGTDFLASARAVPRTDDTAPEPDPQPDPGPTPGVDDVGGDQDGSEGEAPGGTASGSETDGVNRGTSGDATAPVVRATGALARTGTELVDLLAPAGALLVVGVVVLVATRRRSGTS